MVEMDKPKSSDRFTEADLEYACRFWDHDGPSMIAEALDKKITSLKTTVYKLKKDGKFDYYKNLRKHWC